MHCISDQDELHLDDSAVDLEHKNVKKSINNRNPFALKIQCPLRPGAGEHPFDCEFEYGNPFSAAVFRPIKSIRNLKAVSNRVGLMDIPDIFPMQDVDLPLVRRQLEKLCYGRSTESKLENYYQSLASFKEALDIYERLQSATSNLQVTSRPMYS